MIDEASLNVKTERAAAAEALLRSDLLKESFITLRDEYIGAWKITHFKDSESRERLWAAVQIVGKVEDHLKKIIAHGRLATQDLANVKYLKR